MGGPLRRIYLSFELFPEKGKGHHRPRKIPGHKKKDREKEGDNLQEEVSVPTRRYSKNYDYKKGLSSPFYLFKISNCP